MSGLEFIAQLVEALIWPAIFVGCLIVGRRKVGTLVTAVINRVPKMTKLQAWEIAAEFAEQAEETRKAVDEATPSPVLTRSVQAELPLEVDVKVDVTGSDGAVPAAAETAKLTPIDRAKLDRLIDEDPRAGVMMAWIDLETLLRARFVEQFGQPMRALPIGRMANDVMGVSSEGRDLVGILHDLRGLRNMVAHNAGAQISQDAARDYVEAAERIADWLVAGELG
ncbi:hypothetical protein QYN14_25755 [Rhodococcus ruber]|uniref:hypothetical protein n=1 Tax=Rhodococcus ruber TaxID=1830 RepID=UPI00265AFAD4|nr:hypothetical protein [Rhodococcus ruber]WKK11956.1 hypothetical protein QYN14_25340 [Rhodococcus ruber]WKK12039.1 hypothetical protein QYN14_25755 [Rhodococcus ruber]